MIEGEINMAESNLLAYLSIQCRLNYISDLSLTPYCKKVISNLSANRFPLSEWNDAIQYLTRRSITFCSCEEAKSFLLDHPNLDKR